jgi:ABC-type amino acid transport substrate-binding protein
VAKSRPEIYKKLEIDRAKPDHEYHRQFIVFKYSPITVDELNRLLVLLYEDGTLKTLYDKYGLIFPSPETVEDPT